MVEGAIFPLHPQQGQAVEPAEHVWLSASAGTGKTQVLSARVFRLLLTSHVDPAHILCLTFTKAGAAEMANRINATLARWVQLPTSQLRFELDAIGADNGPVTQERARKLFARVLDAPGGGLRIMTIHSFCQTLLAAFPEEAGATPFFRPMEDAERRLLAREALIRTLDEAAREGRDEIAQALAEMSLRMGEAAAEAFLMRCAGAADAMEQLPAGVQPFVRALLNLPREGDGADWLIAQCSDEVAPVADLKSLAGALTAWGTAKTGLPAAEQIADWLAAPPEKRAETLDALHLVWAKSDGDPRVPHKGMVKIAPDSADQFERCHDWCSELIQTANLFAYADLLAGGLAAGQAFYAQYRRLKEQQGLVDFDDLIRLTARLLKRSDMAAWIRYKLDQRTDHILVDEAQDTNLAQWDIVDALADEFFAGRGTEPERLRTLFTVGDFKQAIFGFQGTSPEYYEGARQRFFTRAREAEQAIHNLDLDRSFRSSQPVLDAADAVIGHLGHAAFGLKRPVAAHRSHFATRPGSVTLWGPVIAGNQTAEDSEEDWINDEKLAFAERLAAQIKAWLSPADPLLIAEGKTSRPLRAGDIMLLVSKRDELATLIIARLHAAGIAVAGIDRLRLQQPLAVQDLLATIRFVLQPEDDLNLASLLVSPLLGWTQQELLDHGYRQPVKKGAKLLSLWRHLRDQPELEERLQPLRAMLAMADFTTPYRFLERILSGPMAGRRRLVERLGTAALDPAEELLSQALAFELDHVATLQNFVDWFDRGEVEIKREQAESGDEVRLLTAHGAKGLEAPLVILANATFDPARKQQRDFDIADRTRPQLDLAYPAIPPRKEEKADLLAAFATVREARDIEEHWRLLYVAMTRAKQHLVVAGALGPGARGEIPTDSWYGAVDNGLQKLGAVWIDDPLWGRIRCFDGGIAALPLKSGSKVGKNGFDESVAAELPPWATRPAPPEATPPRPLAPSRAAEDDALFPPGGGDIWAAERGRLIHRLLQLLPAAGPEQWEDNATTWLATQAGDRTDAERDEIRDAVLATLRHPDWQDIFAAESLAEAPIAAMVGEDVISGIIDRLLVRDDAVLIVDYKSGRHVPDDPNSVPVPILRQMAAYAAAVEALFPDRAIRAALLYTGAPKWIELPRALLAAYRPGAQAGLSE